MKTIPIPDDQSRSFFTKPVVLFSFAALTFLIFATMPTVGRGEDRDNDGKPVEQADHQEVKGPRWGRHGNELTGAEMARIGATKLLWNGQEVLARKGEWLLQVKGIKGPPADQKQTATARLAETLAMHPKAAGFRIKRHLGRNGLFLLEAPDTLTAADVKKSLGKLSGLQFLEPNFLFHFFQVTPNDPDFDSLWGLHNAGQSGGTADADIDAPEAWSISTGSPDVIVAVIDSGIDYTHPDLAENVWTNVGEIPGNGIDDDGNSYIDDVHGYDFVNADGDPTDDFGHGTHCAGTIGAVGNNGTGVVGVNWQCKLMALKVGEAGGGYSAAAVEALYYALAMKRDHGVDIKLTSNSWGGSVFSSALETAITATGEAGMLFVAAAGNNGTNNDQFPLYPCSYECDNILSVAATDHDDDLAYFSCYGPTSVDLAAPGVAILSTVPGDAYEVYNGTSMAAPHVAGAAALWWSFAPEATAEQVRQAIVESVDPLAHLEGQIVTGGRLNVRAALDQHGMSVRASSPRSREVVSSAPTEFTVDFTYPYASDTVQPDDLCVNSMPAHHAVAVDNDTVTFTYDSSPVTVEGIQTMEIAAGAIEREGDHDPIRSWQRHFYYDLTLLVVTSTVPSQGQVLEAPPSSITLTFNEPVDPASIGPSDLWTSYGKVTGVTVDTANSATFLVDLYTREGEVRYVLNTRAIWDEFGNPGEVYSGSFTVDHPDIERYESADIPQSIPPPYSPTWAISTLTISESKTIADLEVELDITHTWDQHLIVQLLGPDGTVIHLFSWVGGDGDNFSRTILDDEATTAIGEGSPPFSGRFRPMQALSTLDGNNAAGTWTLRILDWHPEFGQGTLNSWALLIELVDELSPRINGVQPVTSGDGRIWAPFDNLAVRFSEEMEPTTVNDAGNWELRDAGADGLPNTGDDALLPLSVDPPYGGGLSAVLVLTPGGLVPGHYFFTGRSGGLTDLLGNPLDGDADGIGGDDYIFDFFILPRVMFLPFVEDFEAGNLVSLGGYWEFECGPSGRIRLLPAGEAHSGIHHLVLDEVAGDAGPQRAVLHLDLAGQTGVTLDFWQQGVGPRYDSVNNCVEISADGITWHEIVALRGFKGHDYRHFAVDLDAAADAAGLAYGSDFMVRFSHDMGSFAGGGFAFDDIRIAIGLDLFGPKLLSHTPTNVAAGGGPLSNILVSFDEPIDAAGFTGGDVSLIGPNGVAIGPVTVSAVAGSDEMEFELGFAPQGLRGEYRLVIGPGIHDPTGNPMNQNGNAINGEVRDGYEGTVFYEPTVWSPPEPEPVLYAEDFEAWRTAVPTYWSFHTEGPGTIAAVGRGTPHAGATHLEFARNHLGSLQWNATLVVDLSTMLGRDDLFLEFWAKKAGTGAHDPSLVVDLSSDGQRWHQMLSADLPAAYTRYALDLDQQAATNGVALDGNVYIRFHSSDGLGLYVDGVRIVAGVDVEGPRVVSHSPSSLAGGGGPLSNIVVNFDEPINAGSFGPDDVILIGPDGVAISPVTVSVSGGSDDRQFDLSFALQDLRGEYRLVVGPEVYDLACNPMNQDGDAAIGKAGTDHYEGTVFYEPAVWSPPGPEPVLYDEGFEAWETTVPTCWRFSNEGPGTIAAVGRGTPHAGAVHLEFSANGGESLYQDATLVVDLGTMTGRDDLFLEFWAKKTVTGSSDGRLVVDLSGDGQGWYEMLSTDPPEAYTRHVLDLDQHATANGVLLDGDVYIRLQALGSSGGSEKLYLDEVRIVAGVDLAGPRVLNHIPSSLAGGAGLLDNITVSFDEPIDTASFTGEDVSLIAPDGVAISPVTVSVVGGSNDTQFDLDFPAQDLRGEYRLVVGPEVHDQAGNPMNQDGDAVTGEAGADDYEGTVFFEATVWSPPGPEPDLYGEDFEAWETAVPTCWRFHTAGPGTIAAVGNALEFNPNGIGALYQDAILVVDLSTMAGRDDLFLEFWTRKAGTGVCDGLFLVDLSGDGQGWHQMLSADPPENYTRYTLDLDQHATTNGVALDGDVYIRFQAFGSSDGLEMPYLDEVRIVAGVDLEGPRVLNHTPSSLSAGGGPLSNIVVSFDEPIDPGSFGPDDVSLVGPNGVAIGPVTVSVVFESGDMQFDLGFPPQDLRGDYRLVVGPEVHDLAGNPMNQDGDAINEEAGADFYEGTLFFESATWSPPGPEPDLYTEDFETWQTGVPTRWHFHTEGPGTIAAVGIDLPHAGAMHLEFDPNGSESLYQDAMLVVDLSAMADRYDLFLEFWVKRTYTYPPAYLSLSVDLSGDGQSWHRMFYQVPGPPDSYTRYALDLDKPALYNGITLDGSVYIRFSAHNLSNGSEKLYLDDVRIVAGDLSGPRVLSHAPSSVAAGGDPLSNIVVSFDEPIDMASFTGEDVSLRGPDGLAISPVAVNVVDGSDDTQFDLDFPAQDLRGEYRLVVGPEVHDLAGNVGTQTYGASVRYDAAAWSPPAQEPDLYVEDFEAWQSGVPACWRLRSGGGTITAVASGTPHAGAAHLEFDPGELYVQQEATLVIDLSAMTGRNDLFLEFWAKKTDNSGWFEVALSGDGQDWLDWRSFDQDWYQMLSANPPADYTRYVLDLDQHAGDNGVALDGDVYVRFYGYNSHIDTARLYLDDVRIVTGGDLIGPRVVSHTPLSLSAGGGPLHNIVMSFDKAIDTGSFGADDVSLVGPDGVAIGPVTVNVVFESGDMQFDLGFPPKDLRGDYRLVVGPEVYDLAGNPMNQNGNAVNGEAGVDHYEGMVFFAPTVWSPPGPEPALYAEDFEAWHSGAPTYWRFRTDGPGTIAAVGNGTPHAGAAHLEFDPNGSQYVDHQAWLVVDLSTMAGHDDLFLEFWARKTSNLGGLRVYLSGDGQSWHQMLSAKPPADYTCYVLDLDQQALASGVELDGDVHIRFWGYNSCGDSDKLYLDDVRVVRSTYFAWAQSYGLTCAACSINADSDFDSVTNLLEYACNMDPTLAELYYLEPNVGVSGLPAIHVTGSGVGRRLRVEFLRRRNANDLTYIVEFCSDLANSPPDGWDEATGAETVTPIDLDWERVVVEDLLTVEAMKKRFGRVRFESALK